MMDRRTAADMNEARESTMDAATRVRPREGMSKEERRVILASSTGTVFEWYDFFLVGALATEISRHFFSGVNPTAAYIFMITSRAALVRARIVASQGIISATRVAL